MAAVALGIDVGTGSTKVGLVAEDGSLLAVGRSAHLITEPRRGWSETNPAVWLDALTEATAQAMASAGGSREVVAIGFSGQMHGVVMSGSGAEPLRPAVLWSDQRSQPLLSGLRATATGAGHPSGGNPIVAGMAGPTLAAIAEQEPDTYAGIESILQPKDWVRQQLTGVVATDASDASATLLWDPQLDVWSPEACDLYGVNPQWLPPVRRSNETAGTLTASAAAALGLAEGTPVATGAADTAAALLGASIRPGETQISTGTGGQIATLLSAPIVDETARTHIYRAADSQSMSGGDSVSVSGGDPDGPDAAGRHWYAMAAIQNAGIAIDWALGVLNIDIERAEHAVQNTEAGSSGVRFLPYLTGERTPHMDSALTGGWSGLRPGTNTDDLVRSVFEGVAFAIRDGLDALRAVGHVIDQGLLAGGGSTAPWWRHMLADILAINLVPHDAADASVRGAGLLGWESIGHRIDPGQTVHRSAPVEPGGDLAAYAEALEGFRAVAATQIHAADRPY